MIIYNTPCIIIDYEESNSLLVSTFTEKTVHWNKETYQKEALESVGFAEKYKPKYHIIDTRKFMFTITPELQNWVNQKIMPIYKENGLYKSAIVVSENIFSQVSIEQTIEDMENPAEIHYFDSIEDARKWVLP